MGKSNLKLASSPPRSPEREALAGAIAARDAAVRDLDAAANGQQSLWSATGWARERVETATAAIEEAKAVDIETLRAARAALQDAKDALSVAVSAENAGPQRIREAGYHRDRCNTNVDAAVRAVILTEPAVGKLIAEYTDARQRFEHLIPAMRVLSRVVEKTAQTEQLLAWNRWVNFDTGASDKSSIGAWAMALTTDADALIELPR